MYTLGLAFGTISGRAVLVDTRDGTEVATAVLDYPHGVIDQVLPDTKITRPPEIYRALIESTAFGTREIIEAFEARSIEVKELVAAGGLPEKNALLRQIYADVTGRTFKLSGSPQAPALGSAMHAAVAAGVYPNIQTAAEKMGKLKDDVVVPIAANKAAYGKLYAEYKTLYDYFGRGTNDVMKRLKALKHEVKAAKMERVT